MPAVARFSIASGIAVALLGVACSSSEPAASSAGGAAGAAGSATTSGAAGTLAGHGGAQAGADPVGQGGAAGSTNGGVAGSVPLAGSAGSAAGEGTFTVSPVELVFGAVQQTTTAPQTVTVKNGSGASVQLASVGLDTAATGTTSFQLVAPPAAQALAAGASVDIAVTFKPTGIALFESSLVVHTTGPDVDHDVPLFGLGTKGLEGENEPFLKIVLQTLGYDVDVGGAGLLSVTTPLVGSEVEAFRFKAAGAAEVELLPVARYSPEEPIPYGYYTAAGEVEVGVISNDQYQELNPATDAGSKRSFMPPAGEFGIFTTSVKHKTYTDDTKNAADATKHAVRTYPLSDRAGQPITNAYLVCFEEAANGDYQDYVFTISGVVPVGG